MRDFVARLRDERDALANARNLYELHWSTKAQRFCDYGLHSADAVMVLYEKLEKCIKNELGI